jgi:RNA polymerase sigma factor (sigma-70 family)
MSSSPPASAAITARDARAAADLAVWCRDHDPAAFQRLVETFQDLVYAACMRVLHEPAAAEDAAQETFLKLAARAASIQGAVASWLYACAVNTAITALQAERRRLARERRWAAVQPPGGADPRAELAAECLVELDDADRKLVWGYYVDGRTLQELGRERGVTHPTIRKRLDDLIGRIRGSLAVKGYTAAAG